MKALCVSTLVVSAYLGNAKRCWKWLFFSTRRTRNRSEDVFARVSARLSPTYEPPTTTTFFGMDLDITFLSIRKLGDWRQEAKRRIRKAKPNLLYIELKSYICRACCFLSDRAAAVRKSI